VWNEQLCVDILVQLGWRKIRNEGIFSFALPDRELLIYSWFSEGRFEHRAKVAFPSHKAAIAFISRQAQSGGGWLTAKKDTDFTVDTGSIEDLSRCTECLLEWAKSLDYEREIALACQAQEALYPSAIGHLAALALAGNVSLLRYYFKARKRGEEGGLHRIVTALHIERALEIAEGRHPQL
jgi:hypothetical protein